MANEQTPETKKPRLSLSKKYTESGVVAELLTLLETISADGRISDEEVHELNDWLRDNADLNLPGIEFLRTTLRQILADGRVTPDERTALYKAVEKVLPPEARRLAKERRGAAESLLKEQLRTEREGQKQREREERERNRPVDTANFMVAGVFHEGRAEIIKHYAHEDDPVFLVRDHANPHDRYAIEIRLKGGYQIGYVPRDEAANLSDLLDSGCTHQAFITKILQGQRGPIPVVQTYLYRSDAIIDGAVSQSQVPPKQQISVPSHAQGCFARTVLLVGLIGLLVLTLVAIM